MYMSDYIRQLDQILTSGGRPLLADGGKVSSARALEKANEEYRKFQEKELSPVEQAYLETIRDAEKVAKKKSKE